MMKRLLILSALTLLPVSSAMAQTCIGASPLAEGQTRFRGDAIFTSDNRVFGVGAVRGFEKFFGGGGLLLHSFSGDGGVNLGFYGAGGRELPLGNGSKYSVCPVVTLARVSFEGGSNLLFNVAGNVGFEVPTTGTTKIFPTFGASISHESIGNTFGGSFGETFLNLHLGVGLILNEKVSLVPNLVLPIGSDLVDPSFGVTVNLKLGS